MMKTRLALFTIFWSLCGWAAPAQSGSKDTLDEIRFALKSLQPSLSDVRAKYLAETFYLISRESNCQIPWQILASIAYTESSLGRNLKNEKSKDYGLMQINKKNIYKHGLSKQQLMTDAAYSIRFACKILKDNKARYEKNRPYWLGIYRSGTAFWKPKIVDNAKRYDTIVRTVAAKIGYQEKTMLACSR